MRSPIVSHKISLLALVVLLTGCQRIGDQPPVLQREWVANAEFAGDIVASDTCRATNSRFELREGSELMDPVKLVRAGTVEFGVASSDRLLRENESGARLLILAAATYRSPVVFLARAGSGIRTPSDLRTHTIGIQAGTNTELVFDALLKAAGLSRTEMRVVESGWGTATLESATIDVLAAFDYDEPVQLAMKGFELEPPIRPEDHGVRFVGTVYFTRQELASENPAMVQGFVDCLVEGWTRALQDPATAIAHLKSAFPEIDVQKELRSLELGKPYFRGEDGRLLFASEDRWERMAADLIAMGKLNAFNFEETVDYGFLYAATGAGAKE